MKNNEKLTQSYQRRLRDDEMYEERTALRHKNYSILRVFLLTVGFVIAILLLYFGARVFFKVGSISVSGNARYTSEQIINSVDVEYGDFMFSFPSSSLISDIKEKLPYVSRVEIERVYPSQLNITVWEYEPEYICIQNNKYIIVSPELKVLEVSDTNKWEGQAVIVELPEVSRAIEGEKIAFFNIEKTEYISGFINNLSEFKKDVKIDKIFLTDYFNIKMLCEGKCMVSFGKFDSIELKLRTLIKVLESNTIVDSASAAIDISNPKEPRVIPYDRADAIS